MWQCFHCQTEAEGRAPDSCPMCGLLDSWVRMSWVRMLPSSAQSSALARRAQAAESVAADDTPRIPTGTELDEAIGGGLAETSTMLLFGGDGKGKTRCALRMVGGLRSSLVVSLEMPVALTVATARHAGADLRGMDVIEDLDGWELEAEGKRAILLDSISVTPRWSGVLRGFREWATQTRGVVIVIGQVNARGRVLGPNALRHWPDYVVRASDGSKPGRTKLTVQKSRYCARCDAELRIIQ